MANLLNFVIDRKALCLVHPEDGRPRGTGFAFLQSQYFVTAKHVVLKDGLPREPIGLTFVRAVGQPTSLHVRAHVLFTHPILDLAVLEATGRVTCTPLYPGYERLTSGRGLVWFGFAPSRSNAAQGDYKIVTGAVGTIDRILRGRDRADEAVFAFQAPAVQGGCSGGPVLGEGGAVVGVITDGFAAENGSLHARATAIQPLLEEIDFRPRSGACGSLAHTASERPS